MMVKFFLPAGWILCCLAMKRSASDDGSAEPVKKVRYEECAEIGLNDIPVEVLANNFFSFLDPASVLVLSLTSTANHDLFIPKFMHHYPDNLSAVVKSLFEAKKSSNEFHMLIGRLKSIWPRSKDCVIQSRLVHSLNQVLKKAYQLNKEKTGNIPYIPMPEYENVTMAVLENSLYEEILPTPHLIKFVPASTLANFFYDDRNDGNDHFDIFQENPANFFQVFKESEPLRSLQEAEVLEHLFNNPSQLFLDLAKTDLANIDLMSYDGLEEQVDIWAVTLALARLNNDNTDKVLDIVRIAIPYFEDYMKRLICLSDLDAVLIAGLMKYRFDLLSSVALMKDSGRDVTETFLEEFLGSPRFSRINSYLKTFDREHPGSFDIENVVVAVCQKRDESIVRDLIMMDQNCANYDLFMLLCLQDYSPVFMSELFEDKISHPIWPPKFVFPPSFYKTLFICAGNPFKLRVIARNVTNYIDIIGYGHENGLIADNELLEMIKQEILSRPQVVHALLKLLLKGEFFNSETSHFMKRCNFRFLLKHLPREFMRDEIHTEQIMAAFQKGLCSKDSILYVSATALLFEAPNSYTIMKKLNLEGYAKRKLKSAFEKLGISSAQGEAFYRLVRLHTAGHQKATRVLGYFTEFMLHHMEICDDHTFLYFPFDFTAREKFECERAICVGLGVFSLNDLERLLKFVKVFPFSPFIGLILKELQGRQL